MTGVLCRAPLELHGCSERGSTGTGLAEPCTIPLAVVTRRDVLSRYSTGAGLIAHGAVRVLLAALIVHVLIGGRGVAVDRGGVVTVVASLG